MATPSFEAFFFGGFLDVPLSDGAASACRGNCVFGACLLALPRASESGPRSRPSGPSSRVFGAAALPSKSRRPTPTSRRSFSRRTTPTSVTRASPRPVRRIRQVKDFAQAMLTDHTAVNQTVMDLLNAINLQPEDNVTSLDFRDESANKRDILRELDGRAFDTTYMANEVSVPHQAARRRSTTCSLPSARESAAQAHDRGDPSGGRRSSRSCDDRSHAGNRPMTR